MWSTLGCNLYTFIEASSSSSETICKGDPEASDPFALCVREVDTTLGLLRKIDAVEVNSVSIENDIIIP